MEERCVPVLAGGSTRLTVEAKAGEARACCSRSRGSLEKDAADARGFFFGKTALLIGIDGWRGHDRRRDGLAPVLRIKDRAAEIAGQGRPQDGSGIVARQAGQTVRRGAVLGRVEFFAAAAHVAGLERIDQRPADTEKRHRPNRPEEHTSELQSLMRISY